MNTPAAITEFAARHHLDDASLQQLRALSPAAAEATAAIVTALNPSASTLRLILQHADEVSRRDGIIIEKLLSSAEVQHILSNEKLPAKRKQQQLRDHFKRLRYPLMTQIQSALERSVAQILARYRLRIELPAELEGDSLSLTLQFRSAEELRAHSLRIRQLADDPEVEQMLSVLRGEHLSENASS